MNKDYYETPSPNWFTRLLWNACGADKYILERSTYSDHIKYACLGGIVLATGVMAGLAGGYAFYTIFNPNKSWAVENDFSISTSILSVFFGALWGLIIFNLDRFIVTSTGKGDGTEAISKQEIKSAIPRIIMGMIIAITISKPLEIRIFKSEIDAALQQKQKTFRATLDSITHAKYDNAIEQIDKDIENYNTKEAEMQERIDNTRDLYETELRIITVGPKARALKSELDKLENEFNLLKSQDAPKIAELEKRKKKKQDDLEEELKHNDKSKDQLNGLLERMRISHELSPWISFFITLLFMALELTPIFFKLMLIKGPYDYLEENIKELIKAEEGIQVKYDYYKDKAGMERNLVIYHKAGLVLHEKIKLTEAQQELTDHIIEKWKDKEKGNIDKNPEEYIKRD